MKQIYFILTLFVTLSVSAQIPANYYDSANGLTGFDLKTELRNIIANGHTARTYNQLYNGAGINGSQGYVDTHSDVNVTGGANYENDGTVLDFYSEIPNGPDPYNFTHNVDNGGNQNSEGDCYNREHLIPQSSFNSGYPMQSDIHHVIPTDCRVNNYRSNYAFGTVGTPTRTSLNGSKVGSSSMPGYSGVVFEPIDEFKGDIARAVLYFATRYENTINGYTSFDMFNGSNDQVFYPWAIDVLLDWHYNVDPVDQREIERNKAAYKFQGNANPFVDHPEYANMIWNPNPDTEAPTAPTNLLASNPTDNSIFLNWTASTDNIAVTQYDVYVDGINTFNTNSTSFTVTGLNAATEYCFNIKAKDAAGNQSDFSNQACETTTNNGSTGGGECASETFANIGAASSSYNTVTWTGDNGLVWTALKARTDITLTDEAITIDARSSNGGMLTSPAVNGGIGDLTVTTQRQFGGSNGNLDLYVNGDSKGTIPYDTAPITTTISGINVEGSVTIEISGVNADRVTIDDLSWTCYSATVSVEDFKLSELSIHPNPVKNLLHIQFKDSKETQVEIFNILGKRVFSKTIYQSQSMQLDKLDTGIYIMKLTQGNATLTKKIIKE